MLQRENLDETNRARQGVTGHNVWVVLVVGTIGAIAALYAAYLLFLAR